MHYAIKIGLGCFLVAMLAACGGSYSGAKHVSGTEKVEADHVTVQHILIGFEGSVPGKAITRGMVEAEALAKALMERAKAGEDFDALVAEYSDDDEIGVYRLANNGIEADRSQLEYLRTKMVPAFGDVSFSLKVGEIGMTMYDAETSKYGWHIIRRLK